MIKNRIEKKTIPCASTNDHVNNDYDDDSSTSSSLGNICRICHVVENKRTTRKKNSNSFQNKTNASVTTPEKNQSKSKSKSKSFHFRQPQNIIQALISFIQNYSAFFKSFIPTMGNAINHSDSIDSIDSDNELIAPCECRGTMRFVHRGCLNQWRLSSPRSDSFASCEQCFASYTFKPNWITAIIIHPTTLNCISAILFLAWVLASTFVSTGAYSGGVIDQSRTIHNHNYSYNQSGVPLLKLLPIIYFDSNGLNPLNNLLPFQFVTNLIFYYNDFMEYFNTLFYGLVFISLTEFIFFTPSFILSFNTLFCIWRIQKYEIFFDKWLLVGFTVFGINRAGRSLHGMINSAATRIVKLKLLQVANREENEKYDTDCEFGFEFGSDCDSECGITIANMNNCTDTVGNN